MTNEKNFEETSRDYGKELYEALVEICPELEQCGEVYCKLENGENSFMEPFTVERHGNTVFAAYTYKENGDLMYDPAIKFLFDTENKTAHAVTYELSSMGIYKDLRGKNKKRQRKEVEEMALNSMLENVRSFDYEFRTMSVKEAE